MGEHIFKRKLYQRMLEWKQESQGHRLEKLESRDGEKWRTASGYVLTVIIGIVVGYIFHQFGM